MNVRSYIIRDAAPTPEFFFAWWDEWPGFKEFANYLSVTNVLHDAGRRRLYVGICSMVQDILYEFDPATERFESLGIEKVADRFDVKIHKSLNQLASGELLTASAGLHVGDKWLEAPGGKIFLTDPKRRSTEVVGIPVPHEYIQCLSIDEKRNMAYGFTYPGHLFFEFDMARRAGRTLGCMSLQPHNVVIDRDGWVCGMFDRGRSYHLFRYHPKEGFRFIHEPLLGGPAEKGSIIDAMVLSDDGRLFIAQSNGNLSFIDIADANPRVGYLGRPWPYGRMPGLIWVNGKLLACCGDDEKTAVLRIDPDSGLPHKITDLSDSRDGTRCWRVHDIVSSPEGQLYVAETDHLHRSGRLWVVTP